MSKLSLLSSSSMRIIVVLVVVAFALCASKFSFVVDGFVVSSFKLSPLLSSTFCSTKTTSCSLDQTQQSNRMFTSRKYVNNNRIVDSTLPITDNVSKSNKVIPSNILSTFSAILLSTAIPLTIMDLPQPVYADTKAAVEVRGTAVTPFNGLMFQYRGSDFAGLRASDIDTTEPSISYQEFITKMKNGDVLSVQFYAPDGDVAYATLKTDTSTTNKPIRIGEGYPIEQHDGYSSPAFAIRAVQNAGVPYKFIVPALTSSKTRLSTTASSNK